MTEYINYSALIDEAMQGVVKKTLKQIEKDGLQGAHHFFITFNTRHAGVDIGEVLMEKYPHEMTIVMQHQYWDLRVDEQKFSIALSFNGVKHHLTVPFNSLTSFVDPSMKFGIQFSNIDNLTSDAQTDADVEALEQAIEELEHMLDGNTANPEGEEVPEGGYKNNVISLDSFRNKD